MAKKKTINVEGTDIRIRKIEDQDFVCLTDIARYGRGEPSDIIKGYLRNRANVEFLGLWEQRHNENFNQGNFTLFKNEVGAADFYPSISMWIEKTNAIGIFSRQGRYGGTFGHSDIAVQFATWLSPAFYLLFVEEFQRLKKEEAKLLNKEWNLRRELSKSNYHIHTDAVRENLVPLLEWNTKKESIRFASEADLLNMVVFGLTAKEWKNINSTLKGNMRDHASELELQVLANMQTVNSALIELKFTKEERLEMLTRRAGRELSILESVKADKKIKKLE